MNKNRSEKDEVIVTIYNNGLSLVSRIGKDLFYELYDSSNGRAKIKVKVIECHEGRRGSQSL